MQITVRNNEKITTRQSFRRATFTYIQQQTWKLVKLCLAEAARLSIPTTAVALHPALLRDAVKVTRVRRADKFRHC
jgi:hypothetical protein